MTLEELEDRYDTSKIFNQALLNSRVNRGVHYKSERLRKSELSDYEWAKEKLTRIDSFDKETKEKVIERFRQQRVAEDLAYRAF